MPKTWAVRAQATPVSASLSAAEKVTLPSLSTVSV
jgi:hypothetical protein